MAKWCLNKPMTQEQRYKVAQRWKKAIKKATPLPTREPLVKSTINK